MLVEWDERIGGLLKKERKNKPRLWNEMLLRSDFLSWLALHNDL
jgi:hypothetical protein